LTPLRGGCRYREELEDGKNHSSYGSGLGHIARRDLGCLFLDYDFYVVLRDGTEKPILPLQKIYRQMCDTGYTPVDVLADYRNQFDWRSTQPTIERTISNTGVVLYDAARYPKQLVSDEAEVDIALDKAQQIYDFCTAKIGSLLSAK
jgi:hypothetical protein